MPQKGQLGCRRGERCQIFWTPYAAIRIGSGSLLDRWVLVAFISMKNSFVDVSLRPSPSMTVTSGTALQGSPFSMALPVTGSTCVGISSTGLGVLVASHCCLPSEAQPLS